MKPSQLQRLNQSIKNVVKESFPDQQQLDINRQLADLLQMKAEKYVVQLTAILTGGDDPISKLEQCMEMLDMLDLDDEDAEETENGEAKKRARGQVNRGSTLLILHQPRRGVDLIRIETNLAQKRVWPQKQLPLVIAKNVSEREEDKIKECRLTGIIPASPENSLPSRFFKKRKIMRIAPANKYTLISEMIRLIKDRENYKSNLVQASPQLREFLWFIYNRQFVVTYQKSSLKRLDAFKTQGVILKTF
jgi:hypothetical protein